MDKDNFVNEIRAITDAIAQLDSYNVVLFDYLDKHEEIPEMTHACLLVEKMQEQINIIKNLVNL